MKRNKSYLHSRKRSIEILYFTNRMMTLNQPPFSGRNKLERSRENPAAENKYEQKAGTAVWDRSPIPSPSSFSHFLVFSLCRGPGLPSTPLPIHPRIFCMGYAEGIEVALL